MTAQRLFVALFIITLLTMGIRESLDPDMWWHLRTGEYIIESGIPRQDLFSYTVPENRWVTHEWLSQVIMWVVYSVGGLPGLVLFFAGVIGLTFGLVYLCCAGRPYLAGFIVFLAAVASAITWGVRPQMFNMLFMALFVFLVERVRTGRYSPRVMWLLPVLTIVWVNLHSGYLLGVVLLATYFVGEIAEQWLASRKAAHIPPQSSDDHQPLPKQEMAAVNDYGMDRDGIRLLGLVTFFCFLAAALNPNGIELWIYPFETLGSTAMQTYIQEWRPPDFHFVIFWPFAALIALGISGWLVAFRQRKTPPTIAEMLLFLGTAAAGLLSARHIPLFAVVAAPVVCRTWWMSLKNTSFGRLHRPPARKPPLIISLASWLVVCVAVVAAAAWAFTILAQNEEKIAETYPVAAVDYLEANGLHEARGYNRYDWGGYLIWREVPVFVDGRADVYADPFLFYYLQTFEVQEDWQEPLDEYEVTYVLMNRSSPLGTLLAASSEWQEVYQDDLAEIYIRRDSTD
jgi:hypothetical protein